jgi:hypothetical protein
MNARAPGWLPDPTGRHEYRYWDGAEWTPDVSDAGQTAVDPAPGLAAPSDVVAPPDATTVMDPTISGAPTAAYGTPAAPTGASPGYDAPGYGGPGGPGYVGPGYGGPGTASGGYPPAKPPRSGPSTGLLVGLGVLALALVVAIVVVLTGDDGGDDETSTDDTSESTPTTEPDIDLPTTDGDDGSEDPPIDLGGDIDFDDPAVRDMLVDAVAEQFESEGLTREQAECFTGALLDGIGAERLAEIGESGDMSSVTPEDMSSMLSAITDCGLTDLPLGEG